MHLHFKVSRRFLSPVFSFLFLSWENHLKLSPFHSISVSECQKIGRVFSQMISYCIRQCCATLLNWIAIVFTAFIFVNLVNIWWCYSPGIELCYMKAQILCLSIKVQSLKQTLKHVFIRFQGKFTWVKRDTNLIDVCLASHKLKL